MHFCLRCLSPVCAAQGQITIYNGVLIACLHSTVADLGLWMVQVVYMGTLTGGDTFLLAPRHPSDDIIPHQGLPALLQQPGGGS